MFSKFRKKKIINKIPEWASFFTNSEYQKFEKEINRYFIKQKINFSINNDVVKVDENLFGFPNLGLTNVAQICKQEKPKNYRKIIGNHFNSMIKSHKFEIKINKIITNFDKIKKYIGVRIYNNDYVSSKELVLGKSIAGDIFAMLVFDFPYIVRNIQPEHIKHWNKSIDELFEIGKENIRKKYPVIISKEQIGKFSIMFANAEHFFTSNIIFDIQKKPELIGSYGSLIGIPHRHSTLIYPIENYEVSNVIGTLIHTVYEMNKEGPGSISNNIFWYYKNSFIQLPYEYKNNKIDLGAPKEFIEILKMEESP